jgi:hypothetical protein
MKKLLIFHKFENLKLNDNSRIKVRAYLDNNNEIKLGSLHIKKRLD